MNNLIFTNKKGMSTIIVTIIMIVLVLVASGLVWGVVRNVFDESAEDIAIGLQKADLVIEGVKIMDAGLSIKVTRNIGEANLVAINFIIGNGEETEVFEEETTMSELSTKTFLLNYTGIVRSVEIAPVFETDSGKRKIGNPVDKEEIISELMEANLTIEEITFNVDSIDVKVTRGLGEVDLIGISFAIYNGITTETFEKETLMAEETTEDFNIVYTGEVRTFEIAPIYLTSEGERKIGGALDKKVYGATLIDLEIKVINLVGTNLNLKVARSEGEGDLTGIDFVVYNGATTETTRIDTTMGEDTTQDFSLTDVGLIKSVEILPVYVTIRGETKVEDTGYKKEFSNQESLIMIGAVAWWKFENDLTDVISNIIGVPYSTFGEPSYVSGKFGNGADINYDKRVYVNDPRSWLPVEIEELSISTWVKTTQDAAGHIIYRYGGTGNQGFGIYKPADDSVYWLAGGDPTEWLPCDVNREVMDGDWHNIVTTAKVGGNKKIYFDGVYCSGEATGSYGLVSDSTAVIQFGNTFAGTYDETIFFNKELTATQVEDLYNLDL